MNVWIGVGIVLAVCIAGVVYMYRSAEEVPETYEDLPKENIERSVAKGA